MAGGNHILLQDEQQPAAKITMRDMLTVLFRHKKKIILFAMLGFATALSIFFMTPKQYLSDAKLLVRYITDSTAVATASKAGRVISPDRYGQNIINSEMEILRSRDLAEQVVDDLGVEAFGANDDDAFVRDAIVVKMLRNLYINVPRDSNVIRLSYRSTEPELSQEVLSRLITRYLQKHISIHRASGSYEFLSQQTDQLRSRLRQTEEELRELKAQAGVSSVPESTSMLSARIDDLEEAKWRSESALAASQARVAMMEEKLGEALEKDPVEDELNKPEGEPKNEESPVEMMTVTDLQKRLDNLRDIEIELGATYKEDSIPVRKVREQIAETIELLGGETASVFANLDASDATNAQVRLALLDERARIASREAEIEVIDDYLVRSKEEARNIDELGARIEQLEREKQIQDANYRYLSESLEQARIDEALDADKISNISVVQAATTPVAAVRPERNRNAALALVFGLLIGIGLSCFSEFYLDRTMKRPDDVSRILGVPNMASIPFRVDAKGKRAKALVLPTAGGMATEATKGNELMRQISDSFRNVSDRIMMTVGDAPSKKPVILGVTSCRSGSGVTSVAASLSVNLSAGGGRVLLVDTHVGESSAQHMFGTDGQPGLVDIKGDGQGNTTIIQPNLYLLSTSTSDKGAPRVAASQRFGDLLNTFNGSDYEYVIVDMPPVLESGATAHMAHLMDAVILVIEAETDRKEVVARAKATLDEAHASLLGFVFNKRKFHIPNWLYKAV